MRISATVTGSDDDFEGVEELMNDYNEEIGSIIGKLETGALSAADNA